MHLLSLFVDEIGYVAHSNFHSTSTASDLFHAFGVEFLSCVLLQFVRFDFEVIFASSQLEMKKIS